MTLKIQSEVFPGKHHLKDAINPQGGTPFRKGGGKIRPCHLRTVNGNFDLPPSKRGLNPLVMKVKTPPLEQHRDWAIL
ncbi:MAG TPA: hypothetical protein DCR17_01855 [Verrucomicrobiales bacterium]|jgi:hypothetical protein|nr:hypothetical protein [Pedosphaera sp.]MBL6842630.1 hypothetical protein [Verrucomicrobiae bacterium]HAO65419.1 hypothetical protein [Verrucomicrobiales bacterium]HAQ99186.1 hypothetical protein [Verrucomicrobiales bacterium]HAW02189.1 hypothetical protein [Verrucomicrobiales bacterium]|tara:strand:+ start:979 stop:1212 length:234 start_codon:yes stop_codon:yes gene_type:complete